MNITPAMIVAAQAAYDERERARADARESWAFWAGQVRRLRAEGGVGSPAWDYAVDSARSLRRFGAQTMHFAQPYEREALASSDVTQAGRA